MNGNVIPNLNFINSEYSNRLYVDDEGKIKKLSRAQHFKEKVHDLFTRGSSFNARKEAFNKTMGDLQQALINNMGTLEEPQKQAVENLFFTTFPSKKGSLLDSSIISPAMLEFLKTRVQPENPAEEDQAGQNPDVDVRTAQVWARIVPPKSPAVASAGSYIVAGKSEPLGIFKPSDEEPLAAKNKKLGQKIKRLVVPHLPQSMIGSLQETTAGQGYIAEKASYKISQKILTCAQDYIDDYNPENKKILEAQIKNGLVPPTEITEMLVGGQNKVGSFQQWAPNATNAYSHLGFQKRDYTKPQVEPLGDGVIDYAIGDTDRDEATELLNPKEAQKPTIDTDLFDLLVILDYLSGNCDRHGENWLVRKDGTLAAIDGGWSMPPEHPLAGAIELKNQYLWKSLSLADREFGPLGKHIINTLSVEDLRQELSQLYGSYSKETEVDNNRLMAMQERLAVLKTFAEDQPKTIRDLGAIRTIDEVHQTINSQYIGRKDERGTLKQISDLFRAATAYIPYSLRRRKNRAVTEADIQAKSPGQILPPYDSLTLEKKWKDSSKGLCVFIHGMNAHPSVWDAHLEQLEDHEAIDTLTPFVPEKGQTTLKEAAGPIIEKIKDYAEKNPGKPIYLSGHSNGGRICLYIEQQLRKMEPPPSVKMSLIATPLLGTKVGLKTKTAKKKLANYHEAPRRAFRYGSPDAKKLLDKTNQGRQGDNSNPAAIKVFASPDDLHVNFESSTAQIAGAEYIAVPRQLHHPIVDEVAVYAMSEAVAWMEKAPQ